MALIGAAELVAPFAGAVEAAGIDSIGSLGGQILTGVGAGAALSGVYNLGRGIKRAIKRDIAHYRGSRKRNREGMLIPSEDLSGQTRAHIMRDTPMGGISHAGATNVVQRSFDRRRSGKRLRKSAKNAHRLLQASMAYCNLRWQRMFSYGNQVPINVIERPYPASAITNNTENVGVDQQGRLFFSSYTQGTSPNIESRMPGYLFDLTTWRTNAGTQSTPMKRIHFNSTGNVRYDTVFGQNRNGSSILESGWIEELTRGAFGSVVPRDVQKSFLVWSDLRLSLYGARHCPTRFIIEMIQFKKDYFDPNVAASLTSEQQAEVNSHYVSEFKKLIFHPLDVQINKRNSNIRVLSRKVYEVAPDSNTNEDPTSPNILVKIFKRFNRLCNWQWAINNPGGTAVNNEAVQPNIGDTDVAPDPDLTLTEMDQPDFIVQTNADRRPYLNPKARIYLYIRAEAMHTYQGGTLMNSDVALRHWPSFDICARQRWMYEN